MSQILHKPVVAHSLRTWLPLTMIWIYNQVKYQAVFPSIVLAETTQDLDRFPWGDIYATGGVSRLVFKAMRRMRLRSYPSSHDAAIRKHRPAILHSHFGNQGWVDLPIANRYDLKQVVTFYGYDVNRLPRQPLWQARYRQLFERADLFLCEGPHMAKCLIQLGCPEAKVKVHKLGVELDKVPYRPRQMERADQLKILIAGTFREKKGIPYALEAIGLFREKCPGLHVTVVGGLSGLEAQEKEEKDKILAVMRRYNLEPVVTMLGFQPYDVLMQQAFQHHVFLSPSVTAANGDTEGGAPVAIIDMLASGMMVVSTRHCDIPSIVEDGVSGLLAEERDVAGLVQHLTWLVEHPDRWRPMLDAGRKYVEREHDARVQGKRLASLYQSVLS